MRAKKVLAIGCLSAAVLFIVSTMYLTATHSLVQERQVVEFEGSRQREYKILGAIPYEKYEADPNLHVNADFWRAVRRAQIEVHPGLKASNITITRNRRKDGTVDYLLWGEFKGDSAKLAAFYGRQIRSSIPFTSGDVELLGPGVKSGKQVRVSIVQTPTSKPGEYEITFYLGVPGP